MLSFAVYLDNQPAKSVNLEGAYVVGTDDVPVRAELAFDNGIITLKKRSAGPTGLFLLWDVPGVGRMMLDTVRLPEREKPYTLQVELVRARLTRIQQKLEDLGLLDFQGAEDIIQMVHSARDSLIRALQADTPAEAASIADEALSLAIKAGETLSQHHAEALFNRRKQLGGFGGRVLGSAIRLDKPSEKMRKHLTAAADFATIPIVWRDIEPSEQTYNWKPLDAWVELLAKHRLPMKGSALMSFDERCVPDWLYIWEHDFDTIRDLAFEYIRRIINRYGQYINTWDVISGIHADNCFTFSFEQIMELTRMTASLAKQAAPNSFSVINLVAPWGEYYARNQRTIPPLLYADMTVQSGVTFDAFGLEFRFGPSVDGMFMRDMFQISSLIDQFAKLGKPLHITAVEVPSETTHSPGKADQGQIAMEGGYWREPWSEQVQCDWLCQFLEIALSKPFVESVSWGSFVDDAGQSVPSGGLLRGDLTTKPAYDGFLKTRKEIHAGNKKSGRD